MPIRLFVCDDDPSFTHLLELWLLDHADLDVVGFGHTREDCLRGMRACAPDVVLLDTMDRGEPPLTVEDVRAAVPGVRVVVNSGHPPEVARRFVRGSADAYVQKSHDDEEIVAAVRAVHAAR